MSARVERICVDQVFRGTQALPLPPRSYKWLVDKVSPVTTAQAQKAITAYNRWASAFNSRAIGKPARKTDDQSLCWHGPRGSLAWRKGNLTIVMRFKGWLPFDGNGNRLLVDAKDIVWAAQWRQT